ncbi:hypothetical protein I5U08_02310 [Stenotrophomonas maltophilia]|nr:hypothetical protein [Stenotrophomonas maltophilia]
MQNVKAEKRNKSRGQIRMFTPKDILEAFLRANKEERALIVKAHGDASQAAIDYYKSKLQHRQAGVNFNIEEADWCGLSNKNRSDACKT